MVDVKQFAALPEAQRRQEIAGDFAEIVRLQQHSFRNRREVKEKTSALIEKVNGHGLGLATTLIEQSNRVNITDPRVTSEFIEAGGKHEWLKSFWYASFDSLLQAVIGAMSSGRFGDLDAARRVHFLNETTYFTAKSVLETHGWTADFGPHMSFVARKNIDSALSAPPGEEFAIVGRDETLPPSTSGGFEEVASAPVIGSPQVAIQIVREAVEATMNPAMQELLDGMLAPTGMSAGSFNECNACLIEGNRRQAEYWFVPLLAADESGTLAGACNEHKHFALEMIRDQQYEKPFTVWIVTHESGGSFVANPA